MHCPLREPGSSAWLPVPFVTLRDSAFQLDRHVVEQVQEILVKHSHVGGDRGVFHRIIEMWLGFGSSLLALRYN